MPLFLAYLLWKAPQNRRNRLKKAVLHLLQKFFSNFATNATLTFSPFVTMPAARRKGEAIFVTEALKAMTQARRKWAHGIPEGYVDTHELQERLGKSATSIWRMILDGRLPKPFKDGKKNVWDKREIDRWIANGKFLRRGR